VWQPLVAFVVGTAIGVALPTVKLAAHNACRGADLSLRATAFLSLLAANRIAGRHEVAIATSSVACGLAVVVFLPGGREREQGGLLRAYALGFAPPFVLFALLGAGLVAF
jgi:hypothetical protein